MDGCCTFWNYVIPDGSTTYMPASDSDKAFWNYVIPDGSTTKIRYGCTSSRVLELCHSRWFYYLWQRDAKKRLVLELCHSRWFYYPSRRSWRYPPVLELCHSRWFYYMQLDAPRRENVLELCHSRWFYYRFFLCLSAPVSFGTMSFQMVLLL